MLILVAGGPMACSVVEMLVWCALAAVLLPRARPAPPNIVIVTADNIGHSDIRSSSTTPPPLPELVAVVGGR